MTNSMPIQEWLDVIREEYLDGFVKDGGSSIKFAVPEGEDLARVLEGAFKSMGSKLGYQVVSVDSGEPGSTCPKIFSSESLNKLIGGCWRAGRPTMSQDSGYLTDTIDPETESPILEAVSIANSVDQNMIALELRRRLSQSVAQNRNMSRDFRSAMTHLCLTEIGGAGQNQQAIPLIEWLTGGSRRVSSVRAYSIYNSIVRTNARHFVESLLYWVRFVGYSGTVVILSNSRVHAAPKSQGRTAILFPFGGNGPLRTFEGTHRQHRPAGRTIFGCAFQRRILE